MRRIHLVLLFAAAALFAPGASEAAPPVEVPQAAATTAPPTIIAPRIGGYFQVRTFALEEVGVTTFLNRARVGIEGPLPAKFGYRFLAEFQASAGARLPALVSLREAIIRWTSAPFTITAGEFKTPFTREYLIPVPALELADLAVVVDSLAPRYDVGLMAEYALGATATVALGVFNGEGANAIANRDSTVMFVGRVTARPLPQLSLGASGTHDGLDSLRWGVDASVQHLGAVVRAEYVERHRRGQPNSNDDWGWYVFESFRATPRFQLVARQEDFQRPARGVAARVRGTAYGANVEFAPQRVRLLVEFSRRVTGRQQLHTDAYIAQLQIVF